MTEYIEASDASAGGSVSKIELFQPPVTAGFEFGASDNRASEG